MAAKRCLVLFDLGGVLFGSGAQGFLRSFQSRGISGDFFLKAISQGGVNAPFSRAMVGQIGLTQLISELEEDFKKMATTSETPLPETFSMGQIFQELFAQEVFSIPFLKAALTLKNNGFKIAVLTNNWLDDSPNRLHTGLVLCLLRRYFDQVIESCRVGLQKPDPKIYEYTLKELKAKPEEIIFLDDIGANLVPAKQMGMATILVQSEEAALKELQDLTGVQLLNQEEILPLPCEPENVAHGYVTIKPHTQLHFVEMGSGPVICLCHGFPESWLSWRFQIPALVDAGFRVIALEMKGYGDSTAPPDIKEYSQEEICKGISQATFVGHDWAGATIWSMALFYPERVKAVASLNTPYKPANPKEDIMKRIKANPIFDYQLYFQEPGVAEAELEKDLSRFLKAMVRSAKKEDWIKGASIDFTNVRKRGGLLVGVPEDPPPSSLLPEPVLQYFVQQFRKSGLRGPINWYRNMEANWRWLGSAYDRKIRVPVLMVTAGKDLVLRPEMSKGMEEKIPDLTRGHIEDCGHFTQMERPAALNKILIDWLEKIYKNTSLQTVAKL
ncbi:bifunctional epoxide hydrolase 2 isoform X2 [Anolis carolinensis]|uniref:bifunctional epoxide hydrolase 2 isoform X2 n=1 Tax=Anolis carolinensis TaxID=28377 RepID=UPI002F2B737B